jgi:predicted transcriptional regulator
MSTAKDELKRLIDSQPEDATREELLRELAFHSMIEEGLEDVEAGRVVSNEEAKRRMRSWRK